MSAHRVFCRQEVRHLLESARGTAAIKTRAERKHKGRIDLVDGVLCFLSPRPIRLRIGAPVEVAFRRVDGSVVRFQTQVRRREAPDRWMLSIPPVVTVREPRAQGIVYLGAA